MCNIDEEWGHPFVFLYIALSLMRRLYFSPSAANGLYMKSYAPNVELALALISLVLIIDNRTTVLVG